MRAWLPALLWCVATAAHGAEVRGRVLQRGDAAPVRNAEIRVGDTVVAVDGDGRFVVELPDDLPEGTEIVLTVVGPDHLPAEVAVTPPVDKPLRVFLKPADAPAEIVVEAFRPTADLSRHRVDAEQAYETPGTYDDAVRLVQALPGVAVQREFSPISGELLVRGSRPGENRFLLDGIDVPYLYHFGQYASVFPASWLDTLDLYPSGFGARFGDSSGAVVDAVTDSHRPDDVTGSVGLNLVTVGAEVKIPLPKGWWLGVSGRRSYQDLVEGATEQYPLWPRFYDAAIRAERGDDARGHGIFAVVAGDRYDRAVGELDLADPTEIEAAPALRYGRDWQLLAYRHRFPGGRVVAGVLHDGLRAEVGQGARQDVSTLSFPVRAEVSGTITPAVGWSAGGTLRSELSWIDLRGDRTVGPLVAAEAPGIAYGVDRDMAIQRTRASAFGELSLRAGPLRVMPGVRTQIDAMSAMDRVAPTVEPRIAARVRVAEQTELRLGGGRYQQRPSTLRLAVDPSLPTTSGWQVGVGLDQTVANRLEIVVDGYAHFLRQVVTDAPSGPPIVWDRGLSAGGELTLRYRIRRVFFAWAYVTYGRAFLWDAAGRVPSPSDQPVSGGLVVSWNVLPPLQLAVRYRAASGLPFTPIDAGVYDAGADAWIPLPGRPFTDRLPWYQKIDLRVAYTFTFRRWALALSADVWIVPPGNAALYPAWRFDFAEQGLVRGPIVLPLVGVRASF